ncbi:MAG TPA: GxxExxY protein [Allosphingosinicella sp.]|jgi:iron complex transport system substrate-binding protein
MVERLARLAVDAAFHLHCDLGPGLLESVYETLLAMKLGKLGLKIDRQKPIDIICEGVHFRGAFTADILVENRLLIELKSTDRTAPVHVKQVLTYLKLMDLPLGLLMNFGAATFREGIRRVANERTP